MTEPDNLHERTLFATRAAWRELAKVVDEGMRPEDVEKTKGFLHNYSVNWGNTLTRRLAYRVDDVFYGIDGPGFLTQIRPNLESLTPDAVNAAIQQHLQYGNMYVVMITSDAEAMKQKLLSGVPTSITYAGPRPQAVLDEDQAIARFPIPVRASDITIVPIDRVFETGG